MAEISKTEKPMKITPKTKKTHRFSAKTANRRTLLKPKKNARKIGKKRKT